MEESLPNDARVPLLPHSLGLHPSPRSLTSLSISRSPAFSVLLPDPYFSICVLLVSLSGFPFVTITTNCHTALYKIQVLVVEGDRVQHAESMKEREREKNCSDSSTNCSCFQQSLNSGSVTQSSGCARVLSPAWILFHISCCWLLSALHLFISSCSFCCEVVSCGPEA